MKRSDSSLEIEVMRSLLDSQNRGAFLSKVQADFFSHPGVLDVFTRVSDFMKLGKDIPSTKVFKTDNVLTEDGRMTLVEPGTMSDEELNIGIHQLDQYRKTRILGSLVQYGLETLAKDTVNEIDTLIQTFEDTIETCRSTKDDTEMFHYSRETVDQIAAEIVADLEDDNSEDVIKTGLKAFDDKSGGLHRKNVLVMASVPGGGKSALALHMATTQYKDFGLNVCIVSYEMDAIELRYRMLSSLSRIDHSKINLKRLSPKHIKHIETKFREFVTESDANNKLTIWTPSKELTVQQIAMELKPMGYDAIYIDYISLLKPTDPKKAMWEILGDHSRHAKLAANNLDAAVILLAQYDDEGNKLKYSKAIQANANFVWVWDHGEKERESGLINIRHLKARNAPVYNFFLEKDFSTFTFNNYFGPAPVEDDEEEATPKSKSSKRKPVPSMPELRG